MKDETIKQETKQIEIESGSKTFCGFNIQQPYPFQSRKMKTDFHVKLQKNEYSSSTHNTTKIQSLVFSYNFFPPISSYYTN